MAEKTTTKGAKPKKAVKKATSKEAVKSNSALSIESFAKMALASKSVADLEKKLTTAGHQFDLGGVKRRLLALRQGGVPIPKLDGEDVKPGKTHKDKMRKLAESLGLKFDEKGYKEPKPRGRAASKKVKKALESLEPFTK